MAKDMTLTFLLDLYGELLSVRQREIFDGYYNEDLSLSELAEAYGITRQGVLQTIHTAERKLRATEDKLQLAQSLLRNRKRAEDIETLAAGVKEKAVGEQIALLARQIWEEL